MKKAKTIIKKTILIYILYAFVSTLVIFKIPLVLASDIKYDVDELQTIDDDNSYAHIIESVDEALNIRIALIEAATETIDIAVYKYLNDLAGEIISGAILKQANKGIKVRILVDGKSYNKGIMTKVLTSHPNIEYHVFEPFSFLSIYRINNSMHDKFLITDNKYALIGGRNIDSRFMVDENKVLTYDRDALIFSKDSQNKAVNDMTNYFNELLNSKYNKTLSYKIKSKYGKTENKYIKEYLEARDSSYKLSDIEEQAISTDRITFLRGPLNRFNKEPVSFNVINDLINGSDSAIIQSPYITSSNLMKIHFKLENNNIQFITNNMKTNPNIPALSGYIKIRKDLAKEYELYEYQGENSIHAKTYLIGENISIIGSQNLDHRSMFLSTESSVVIYSKEFNLELKNNLNSLINNSLLVDEKGKYIEDDNVNAVTNSKIKNAFVKGVSFISSIFSEMLIVVE